MLSGFLDFYLPRGRNWSLHKYVFVHLQVYSVGLDHECWMNAHWPIVTSEVGLWGEKEQCHLGSVLAQGMHCGHVWWQSLDFPGGAWSAGLVSGSPGGGRAWENPQGVTGKSLPAVKVLGFGFQRKGSEYGLTEFSELSATKGLS